MPFSLALDVPVPANTTEPNGVRIGVDMPAGILIEDIVASIPAGHQGEVPFMITHDRGRLFPTNNAYYRLDDAPDFIVYRGSGFIIDGSGRLEVFAFNEDTVNPHTFRVYIRGKYAEEFDA